MTPEEIEELIYCIKIGNRRAILPFAIIGTVIGLMYIIIIILRG